MDRPANSRSSLSDAQLSKPLVVHVIDSLLGWGGAENRLVEEVIAMSGLRQVVVRLFDGDSLDRKLTAVGVPVVALAIPKETGASLVPLAVKRLREVISQLQPDVVHTSLALSNLAGQLATALFRPRIPVVSTLTRSGDAETVDRFFNPSGARWKVRTFGTLARTVGRMDHVTYRAVAEHVRESSHVSLGIEKSRIAVVPRGIEAQPFIRKSQLPESEMDESQPLFVNVGRLSAVKGQEHLLRAFRLVLADLPGATLAIAGEGQDAESRVRGLVDDLGIAGQVRFLGYVRDVASLLADCDAVVVSSLTEGLPGVMLEAMAVGAPIVAFDIPGTREASGDGAAAVLVPAEESDSLAQAVIDLYRDANLRERLVVNGRKRVEDIYNLHVIADRLTRLLVSAVEQGASRSS